MQNAEILGSAANDMMRGENLEKSTVRTGIKKKKRSEVCVFV